MKIHPHRLRRAPATLVAALAVLAAVPALSACGSDEKTATAAAGSEKRAAGPAGAKAGTDIPMTTVKFGMAPFADASFYVIAMRRGWFKDAGIDIQPQPDGVEVTPDNIVQKMVTGEADVATFYGPGKIANQAKAPDIKMFGFSDTYVGNYFLAPPGSGAKTVGELVKGGMSFDEAIKTAMAPVKGTTVAFTNSGQHRDFLEGIFTAGGLKLSDVEAVATNDARILSLAKGGKVAFASPEGAAQNVELLNQGWLPVVTTTDLLDGLPPGDPRAVALIGHEGPAATQEWLDANPDAALRILSVMFRTIDAIKADPEGVLPDMVPYLSARSGLKVTIPQLKTVMSVNHPLVPFEEQTQYWTDLDGTRSFQTVYAAQIASAQKAGILPKDQEIKPEDAIVGKKYYDELVALKAAYDKLVPEAEGLSGDKAATAEKAATLYEQRNYLDAYRFLQAAVGS